MKNSFMHHEIKYLLKNELRFSIEHAMTEYMTPDIFGKSTVCSVYYDTPDYRLIRRSLEKPIYKEKLRIRSYGTAQPGDSVFLELKKKYNGVVYKRRISLSEHEAEDYMNGLGAFPIPSQIGKEIDYFRSFYGYVVPAMYISCERSPFYSKDNTLRITFDQNILWRATELNLTVPPHGQELLEEGYSLMEIKTAVGLPLWLTQLLTKNKLLKTNFSKYGTAYQQLRKTVLSGEDHFARSTVSTLI